MRESEFLESIDCNFPYGSPTKWRRTVCQASTISVNAAFMVIHELCRPPRSVKRHEECARRILSQLFKRFKHPLLRSLKPAIESHIKDKHLPVAKAAFLMRKVARHPGQYNALAICYFSCNDRTGVLDPLYERIISTWSKA